MNETTGAESPPVNNTELVQTKPEGGLLNRIRRVLGGKKAETTLQPKTEAELLAERGVHQAHLDSVAAWSQESHHPGDQQVINETTSKIEGIDAELRKIQEAELPTPPSSGFETQTQPTAIPVAPQEEPAEQPKAA